MSNTLAPTKFVSETKDSVPLDVIGSEGKVIVAAYEGSLGNGNLNVYNKNGELQSRIAGGTFKSFINNGQNVGIGTPTPTALLDVNGSLKAESIEVSGPLTLDGTLTVKELTVTNLPDARTAPDDADLETVVVDKATGILYQQ
jgi:hypothetical protein